MKTPDPNLKKLFIFTSFFLNILSSVAWTVNVNYSGIITEYDDKLTRQLVEKITVFEGKVQVDFKSGVEIEVEI